jgi:hypothetical protein
MEEQLQMVADCEARESRLSDWERGFVDSIGKWLRDGTGLTKKQADTLNDIWEKATAAG